MPISETTPIVYFDEAGNTGAQLLDPEQPVFILASVDFTGVECEQLLAIVRTPQAAEAKFTSLRKSAGGQAKLLKFIQSPLLEPTRAKVTITHKPYMVMGKMVDMIVETLAHEVGLDLYKDGANLGLTNMHFLVAPVFCGRERFDKMLASFVSMVRTPTPESKSHFFEAVRALQAASSVEKFKADLSLYLAAEPMIDEVLSGTDYNSLDPAIPAFFYLCSAWGMQYQRPFDVVHDSSKPIASSKALFENMMDSSATPKMIGYDRRKFEFPLRATGITFGDSKENPGLQVADLLAGTVAYFATRVANSKRDKFCDLLDAAGVERFNVQSIWPEMKVTPNDLGTATQPGETAATERMTTFLRNRGTTQARR
jgi:hypothetical protein